MKSAQKRCNHVLGATVRALHALELARKLGHVPIHGPGLGRAAYTPAASRPDKGVTRVEPGMLRS